jgi:hypothetical protein
MRHATSGVDVTHGLLDAALRLLEPFGVKPADPKLPEDPGSIKPPALEDLLGPSSALQGSPTFQRLDDCSTALLAMAPAPAGLALAANAASASILCSMGELHDCLTSRRVAPMLALTT